MTCDVSEHKSLNCCFFFLSQNVGEIRANDGGPLSYVALAFGGPRYVTALYAMIA